MRTQKSESQLLHAKCKQARASMVGGDKEEQAPQQFMPESKLVFADSQAMKARLQEALAKPQYNVMDFYKTEGRCQELARSTTFENVTLCVIAMNSFWIAYDTDANNAELLIEAAPHIIVVENFFCIYYTVEVLVRLGAYQYKRNCLKDGWFKFDFVLVVLMIFETWVISAAVLAGGGDIQLPDSSIMKVFRLLKLARIGRMARLLRAAPELLIMVKALGVALRSVLTAFGLLIGLTYVFAILFRQMLKDTASADIYFVDMPFTMKTLLMQGAFPDQQEMVNFVGEGDTMIEKLSAFVLVIYLLLAAITVLNMLVGILCDVVTQVSTYEKEEALLLFVKESLQDVLASIGITLHDEANDDSDGARISRSDFEDLLTKPGAIKVIHQVGVDVIGLVDQTDFIFENDQDLTFAEFFDLILKLRGTNNATVKDMVDLRKLLRTEMDNMQELFKTFQAWTVDEVMTRTKTEISRISLHSIKHKAMVIPSKKIHHSPLEAKLPPLARGVRSASKQSD